MKHKFGSISFLIMEQLNLSDISKELTIEVLDSCFKKNTSSTDAVQCVEMTRASAAGEGFLSAVYRLYVTGETHKVTFVVKGLVQDYLLRSTLNCERYFKREAQFFTDILPVLIEIQQFLGAREKLQNSVPICYRAYSDGENDFMLMEDMVASGCKSLSEDLSIEERDLTLKTLAHLHAVSIALRVKKPETFEKIEKILPEVFYTEDRRDFYANYLRCAMEIDRAALAEYEEPSNIYYKKFMEVISEDVYGQLIYLTTTETKNKTFNHGDAWCPNFMISRDRCVAIDYQIYRCASPATDLCYFIMVSGDLCRSDKDFKEAVEVYYNSLKYFLEDMSLNSKEIFSFEDLQDEIMRFGKYGLLASLTSIPLRSNAETCDVLESMNETYLGVEKIPLEDVWRLRPLTNDHHKLRLVNIVRVAVDVGII